MEIVPEERDLKFAHVKNKSAAPIQITAEQILREANDRREMPRPPKRLITDDDELYEVRLIQRKAFEDSIRRNRTHIGTWLKYAAWEELQLDFRRARSVFERALEIDTRNIGIWLKYVEMEMRHKFINHARNIFDRAVTHLPRVDTFWYKFAYMEELLGNVEGAREIFLRWMKWEPSEEVWGSFIKFEKRFEQYDNCREIFEQLVLVHPTTKNWLKYAKFEEQLKEYGRARGLYERACEELENPHPKLFVTFAKFEVRSKEYERARAIFKYALKKFPKNEAVSLYNQYSLFEKQHGTRTEIEEIILEKQRQKYETLVAENPHNYDSWFDFAKLEQENGGLHETRDVFERAVAFLPPAEEKTYWRRYIYLWINYAVYEELEAKDYEKALQIFQRMIEIIPHKKFTFAKVWFMYACFLIRRMKLNESRKLLGSALGMCPKPKLFKYYIQLESQLREFDRCRILYAKYLEYAPYSAQVWIDYSELENLLGEEERARGLFEIAVNLPELDIPDLLWKRFIDFETTKDHSRARILYERLLEKTQHVKVWISFAKFETDEQQAREIFERAYQSLKEQELDEDRVVLLEAWKEFEDSNGRGDEIVAKFPKRVKKKRSVVNAQGMEVGFEEYIGYVFPDDESSKPHLKLLEMAQKWKSKG